MKSLATDFSSCGLASSDDINDMVNCLGFNLESDLKESNMLEANPAEGNPASTKASNTPEDSSTISSQANKRVDVLYGLCITRGTQKEVTHYSDKPFSTVKYGPALSGADHEKVEPSILTLSVTAQSLTYSGTGNNPENWWKDAVATDFAKDIAFQKSENVNLTINSRRLLSVMEQTIDYNPAQLALGYEYYVADDDYCFPGLLLYYDALKDCYLSYLQPLLARQSPEAKQLPIQPEALGDTSWLPWGAPFGRTEPVAVVKDYGTAYDVGVLLRTLTPSYKHIITPLLQKMQGNDPQVEFKRLWLIYKPGSVVYRKKGELLSAYVVVSAKLYYADFASTIQSSRVDRYIVEIWNLEYDGQFLRRKPGIVRMEHFDGPRPLNSLPLIPSTFYDKFDEGTARSQIERQGKQFLTLIQQKNAHRLFKHSTSSYEGQIILDPVAYEDNISPDERKKQHPEENPRKEETEIPLEEQLPDEPRDSRGYRRFRTYHDLDTEDAKQLDLISPEHLFLFSPLVKGLALSTKKWMRFAVEGISDESPFQQTNKLQDVLVLANSADREVLQTVKKKTAKTHTLQSDFVPGKGDGQVFLLYGPSGTGKTLTAECIANDTRRPLISLTPSDIGEYMMTEYKLRTWFSLAAKWGAVLLIDEADIFLEKRNKTDAYHSYLATVFLRTLEYYAGVLFLTTNRPGQIDDSFVSRISIPIGYPALSKASRREIWERFIQQYESTDEVVVSFEAREFLLEDPAELNGREIRAVFQNAIAFAELDAEKRAARLKRRDSASASAPSIDHPGQIRVTEDHFKKALKRSKDFKKYLETLNFDRTEHERNKLAGNYV